MIHILDVGMNHESAEVSLRESLCMHPDTGGRVSTWIREEEKVKEGMFVSTCNRVELFLTTEEPEPVQRQALALFAELGGRSEEEFLRSTYCLKDEEAIRHVFAVASSLDSMVLGEPQILGQIKTAYAHAARSGLTGTILNRLMHRAFHVAKRVRTETGICGAAVSISYAAVELAKKIFYTLEDKRVFLVGAGEMAELAARHLQSQGIREICVANRTFKRAVELAETFRGRAVAFEEIVEELASADIVITSTASVGYIITCEQVRRSLKRRRNRPLFLIDIAVPRDVEPSVHSLGNVYLYDIDDLRGVTEMNLNQRRQEAIKAERILDQEVITFRRWLETLSVVPTIVSLREKADLLIKAELKRSNGVLERLSSPDREAVVSLVRSVAEKLLNDPILFLKNRAERSTIHRYLDMTQNLFNLNRDQGLRGAGGPGENPGLSHGQE